MVVMTTFIINNRPGQGRKKCIQQLAKSLPKKVKMKEVVLKNSVKYKYDYDHL